MTNAAGNLVDLNGNQINGAFLSNYPGFPGFSSINAAQSLAYVADMQEAGVPVTYAYISDIHGNEHIPGSVGMRGSTCSALGSGSACYVEQAAYYNAAFGTFFQRLAADGITANNTLFLVSSDEGDHEAGANVGRAMQPTPANCDGMSTVTPAPTRPAPSGSSAANVTGLLATEKGDTTPFSLEADSAPEFYVTGNPSPSSAEVRPLDRDVGSLTAFNPYTGHHPDHRQLPGRPNRGSHPAHGQRRPGSDSDHGHVRQARLLPQQRSATCLRRVVRHAEHQFAWDHGDYAAEIDTNYLGLVGRESPRSVSTVHPLTPGRTRPAPQRSITVPGGHDRDVDRRNRHPAHPHVPDWVARRLRTGRRVITEVLATPNPAITAPAAETLGQCYKQLNSSVGQFGTATLMASTRALESTTPMTAPTSSPKELSLLDHARDLVAGQIKQSLTNAEFNHTPVGAPSPNWSPAGGSSLRPTNSPNNASTRVSDRGDLVRGRRSMTRSSPSRQVPRRRSPGGDLGRHCDTANLTASEQRGGWRTRPDHGSWQGTVATRDDTERLAGNEYRNGRSRSGRPVPPGFAFPFPSFSPCALAARQSFPRPGPGQLDEGP